MPKKEEKKTVSTEKFLMVKCQLTTEEILEAGQKLADAQNEIERLKNELDSFKSQMKAKTSEAEAVANRCGSLVREKYEHRKIKCTEVRDYDEEIVYAYRNDTGETVESRKMTADELSQLAI